MVISGGADPVVGPCSEEVSCSQRVAKSVLAMQVAFHDLLCKVIGHYV